MTRYLRPTRERAWTNLMQSLDTARILNGRSVTPIGWPS